MGAAIVLPGVGEAGAREVAERVRKAVAERPVEGEGGAVHATVSGGVAWFRPLLTRGWQVRRAAEGRLFDAKLAGRNQVK